MLLPKLREEVLEANLELVRRALVLYTFGNSSGISREDSLLVIKPSGVPYETMKPEDLVVTDLHGKIIEAPRAPTPSSKLRSDQLRRVNPSGFCGGAALLRRISASC